MNILSSTLLCGTLLLLTGSASPAADSVFWCANQHSSVGHGNDYADVMSAGFDGSNTVTLPLYELYSHVEDVAVDLAGGHLYRSVTNTIRRTDTAGANALATPFHTGSGTIRRLAIDATHLYWIEGNSLLRKALATPAAVATVLRANLEPGITALAIDSMPVSGPQLYFAAESNVTGVSSAVYRVDVSAPGAVPFVFHDPEDGQPVYGLSVDECHRRIYTISHNASAYAIRSVDLVSGAATPVMAQSGMSTGWHPDIVVDGGGGKVFWTATAANDTARLYKANLDGGSMEIIHEVQDTIALNGIGNGGLDLAAEKRCSATCPPSDMLLWLPFDEPAGSGAGTRNFAGAPHGARMQGNLGGTTTLGPTPVSGFVTRSLVFDGNDYVDVPWHSRIDIGTGNFSLDAWVKLNLNTSGVRTLMDHRVLGASIIGYHWFINTDGSLGLQLGDGSFNSFTSAPVTITPGVWHLLAVTVERSSSTGIKFYIDGNLVAMRDPTARQGSLANSSSFRVGARNGTPTGHFPGGIDEVELFGRALGAGEVKALYDAKASGKCKFGARVPLYTNWCYPQAATVSGEICNRSPHPMTFQYQFGGFPGGLTFTPAGIGEVTVPPGGCVTVSALASAPSGSPRTQQWQLNAWPKGSPREISTGTGTLRSHPAACVTAGRLGAGNGTLHGRTVFVPGGLTASDEMIVRIMNVSSSPLTDTLAGYAKRSDGSSNPTDFSLNGLAAGASFTQPLNLAPGASVDVPVNVRTLREGLLAETDVAFTLASDPAPLLSLMIMPEELSAVTGDLSAAPAPNGSMTLTWPAGILEETSDLSTWIAVPGAAGGSFTAPVSSADQSRRFFRSRQ